MNFFDFIGGNAGQWHVKTINAVVGESLEKVSNLHIIQSFPQKTEQGIWVLKGFTSNVRYIEKTEKRATFGYSA